MIHSNQARIVASMKNAINFTIERICKCKTHTCCDSSETLLACCIPNLQFNPSTIKLDGSYLKINAVEEKYR
jgi:hypothetical protein